MCTYALQLEASDVNDIMYPKLFSCTATVQTPSPPLAVVDISSSLYWRHPFKAVGTPGQLTEYFVLQTEPVVGGARGSGFPVGGAAGGAKEQFQLMDLWVTRSKDVGMMDQQTHVRSHLGHLLHPGDTALGWAPQHPTHRGGGILKGKGRRTTLMCTLSVHCQGVHTGWNFNGIKPAVQTWSSNVPLLHASLPHCPLCSGLTSLVPTLMRTTLKSSSVQTSQMWCVSIHGASTVCKC